MRYYRKLCKKTTAVAIVLLMVFYASPLPVMARTSQQLEATKMSFDLKKDVMEERLRSTVTEFKEDLAYLEEHGKEKFNTRMFERLDEEQEHLLQGLEYALTDYGPKKFVEIMLGWSNPVIQDIVQAILSFTMQAVYDAIEPFIRKAIKRLKEELVRISEYYMKLGLENLIDLLERKDILAGEELHFAEKGFFQDFFSDSTVVKNFLIAAVSVSSIAVAIGISLSTGGVAPIVAVLGGLVSLIALIEGDEKLIENKSFKKVIPIE